MSLTQSEAAGQQDFDWILRALLAVEIDNVMALSVDAETPFVRRVGCLTVFNSHFQRPWCQLFGCFSSDMSFAKTSPRFGTFAPALVVRYCFLELRLGSFGGDFTSLSLLWGNPSTLTLYIALLRFG